MSTKVLKGKFRQHPVMFGCDPEFFFEKNGKVIGSEKVIDLKKGLKVKKATNNGSIGQGDSKFIVDGVQAELNPRPDTCRARLANEISHCFRMLHEEMQKDKELSINFAPTVKITKEELMALDKSSQVFGCAPTKNIDKNSVGAVKLRDPKKYMYRSAGGHIHLGLSNVYDTPLTSNSAAVIKNEPERLIAIMDILVGNTCVLIDRDPSNVERRKVYGRAGEFRTPPHGLEYRTLSNFWLRAYPLMSFVMALSRMAVSVMASSAPGRDFEAELLKAVNINKVRKAINTNNFSMAWENFQNIKPFLIRHSDSTMPLHLGNIEAFEYFVGKGLDHWFKSTPMEHWIKLADGHSGGWETFIEGKVQAELKERPTPMPNVA